MNTEPGDNWFYNSADGFYYYRPSLVCDNTDVLIDICFQKSPAPSGYYLNVEIIAQTIQALGTTDDGDTPAVTDAWNVFVVDGELSLTPPETP